MALGTQTVFGPLFLWADVCLGYCVQLWGSQHRKDVSLLEQVQSRAMKILKDLQHFYEVRQTERAGALQLVQEKASG